MASSQIEIASAASPSFGCILRDHNQRDGFRESGNGNSRLAIQKNIKEFVKDLHACSTSGSVSINDPNQARQSETMTPNGLRNINARPENDHERVYLVRSAGNSPSMGGASSLVQMWEARMMNRTHSFNKNTINSSTSSSCSSRTNSGMSNTECNASELKKPEMEMDDDEIEMTASESASESERVRVADIIKRLTKTSSGGGEEQGASSNELSRESSPDILNPARSPTASSPKKTCPTACSVSPRVRERSSLLDPQQRSSPRKTKVAFSNLPRLRGRQAIQDLLMQMERDRQSEICSLIDQKAVSKFSQKGRIQSMLRLKVLQRGLMSPQDHLLPSVPACPKGTTSSIAARRSRFDPEAKSQVTLKPIEEESSSRGMDTEIATDNIPKEVANSTLTSSSCPCQESTANSHSEPVKPCSDTSTSCKEDKMNCHKHDAAKRTCKVGSTSAYRQPGLSDDSLRPEATMAATAILLPSATEQQHVVRPVQQQPDSDISDYMPEMGRYVTWEDPCLETNEGNCWDGNASMMIADDYNSQQCEAESSCYYDWFSDICRPRSYWEDRRQAWYQEVLETTSEDAEIRQLLERKTVSNFLDSSFRLRMDQLMMSRLSHQAGPVDEDYPESQDRTNQAMMRFFSQGLLSQSSQQEQNGRPRDRATNVEQIDQDEEEEDGNILGSEYNEVSSYFEQNLVSPQLPLPSPMSSSTWSSFSEPELSEDSEQAGLNQPQGSSFHYTNIRVNPTPSSTNPTSLEMELIYDLKGQMEKLYHEMTALRKSIRCCMDMQGKLHHTFKQQPVGVACAIKKPENNGTAVSLKKGSCCICYEMPVDSLLYRCGHMCACLKCAQELQWSSGRCPICRAPIMDVVRAYTD